MISQFFRNMPAVVKNFLIINILMYLATLVLMNKGIDLQQLLSIHNFKSPDFRPYQIVTNMFMHGNSTHLLFNMITLVIFGTVLERVWGAKRFFIFYFVCGIGAVILSNTYQFFEYVDVMKVISPEELDYTEKLFASGNYYDIPVSNNEYRLLAYYDYAALGASGAIFGLLVAFAVLFPNTELMLMFIPVPVKAKYMIPFMILIEISLETAHFSWDNIGHLIHLSGGLIGFILVKIWQRNRNTFY